MAAPFLRPTSAGFTAPLCKNGDATRGPRAPHRVDRSDHVQDATSAPDGTSLCVMGGLWMKHKKRMSRRDECDHGTSDRFAW